MEVLTGFFHQMLSLEILHERIYRLVRYLQRFGYVFDPQYPESEIAESTLRTRSDSTGRRGSCARRADRAR